MTSLPAASSLTATTDSMLTVLSASDTESVPRADDLRPVKGNVSGPRWHWELMLTRPTESASASTSGPIFVTSFAKTAACWPKGDSARYS